MKVPIDQAQYRGTSGRKAQRLIQRLWRAFNWITSGLGLLVLVVSFTVLVPRWAHRLGGTFGHQSGDVLIVLGAARAEGGVLSYSSYLRISYALDAFHEGWVHDILLTGNGETDQFGVHLMKDFLVAHGVPASIIRVETISASTRENALFSKPLLQDLPGTKVLMTSDYHMFRASRVFLKAGIRVVPRPIPDAVKAGQGIFGRWPAFLELCTESVKIVYYRARGWI